MRSPGKRALPPTVRCSPIQERRNEGGFRSIVLVHRRPLSFAVEFGHRPRHAGRRESRGNRWGYPQDHPHPDELKLGIDKIRLKYRQNHERFCHGAVGHARHEPYRGTGHLFPVDDESAVCRAATKKKPSLPGGRRAGEEDGGERLQYPCAPPSLMTACRR